MISCSNDCLIKSWDSTTLQNVSKFNGHSKKINCLITQNDQIYSGGNDLIIKVIDNYIIIKVWDHKQ